MSTDPESMPEKDARISIDLDDPSIHEALKKINPILQEIVRGMQSAAETQYEEESAYNRTTPIQFHRIMFSSCSDI